MYFDDPTSAISQVNDRAESIGSAGSGREAHHALQAALQSRPSSTDGALDTKPFVQGGMQIDHATSALPDSMSGLQTAGLPSEMLGGDSDDLGVGDELGSVHRNDVVDVGEGDVAGSGEY